MKTSNTAKVESNNNSAQMDSRSESPKAVLKNIKIVKVQTGSVKARGPRDCFPLG